MLLAVLIVGSTAIVSGALVRVFLAALVVVAIFRRRIATAGLGVRGSSSCQHDIVQILDQG